MKNGMLHEKTKLDADYVDLRSLLQSLVNKKWLIIATGVLLCALALIYTALKPTNYQSSILLKIQHKQHNVLGSITNPNHQLGFANMPEEPLAVQIALIQSEFILEPVIKKLGLDINITQYKTSLLDTPFDVLKKIRSNLTITDLSGSSESSTNKTAILRVSLIGRDPVQIRQILNQIALTTQQQNIQLKKLEADKTLTFIKQQLPITLKSLKESETQLNDYRSANGKIDSKLQKEYLLNHLSDINKRLDTIRLKKINFLQQYTSNHPLLISANQEFAALENSRNELNSQLNKLPASEQETLNLKRQVDVKNSLYLLMLNQIHQLEVIKTGIMSDIEILSPASVPYIFQPTKITIIGLLGLLTGLILGCILVLGRRIWTQCF